MRLSIIAAFLALVSQALAQAPAQPHAPIAHGSIEVVAVTPVDGAGVDADKYPANVQTLAPDRSRGATDSLLRHAANASATESQANRFQPDLSFRGFLGSPLLGTPQGIAVFQDGVRLNEAFGDVVNWDVLPDEALASIQVIPGSNAAFGLNALGGVVTLRTKTGFTDPGSSAELAAGSFGSRHAGVTAGIARGNLGCFLAFAHEDESGWRDFAPSRIDHMFGSIQHAAEKSSTDLRLTLAGTALTGNGSAPVQLLAERRAAVFTYPDETRNRAALISSARNAVYRVGVLDLNAFVRRTRTNTVNGDASPYGRCADAEELLCDEESGEVLLDRGGAPIRPTDEHPLDAVLNRTGLEQTMAGATAQLSRVIDLFGRAHRVAIGGSFDRGNASVALDTELADFDETRGANGIGLVAENSIVRLDTTTSNAAIFVTDVVSLTDRATVTAALRANRSRIVLRDRIGEELSGDHHFASTNPSIGVAYALRDSLTAFAQVGQSSRTPTPVELTCANPDDPCRLPNAFVSDPPLAQVIARSFEAGVRGRMRAGQWSLAAYRTVNDDDIIFASSGPQRGQGYFANVGKTLRAGIEASARGFVARRFEWDASYALLDATFREAFDVASPNNPFAQDGEIHVKSGDRLPLVPRHTAKVSGTVRIAERLRVTAGARYVSSAYFRGDEANLARPLPAYVTTDAALAFVVAPRLAIELTATNLGNVRYATFGTFGDAGDVLGEQYDDPRFVSPGQPRAVRVALRFTSGSPN